MADEMEQTTEQVENEPAFTPEQQEIVQSLVNKAVEETTATLKPQLDGVHRRNSQLEKDLEAERKRLEEVQTRSLSEEERLKIELDRREAALNERDAELLLKSNREKAIKYATENNIPLDLIEVVSMTDEEAMLASLGKIKTVVDGDRASVIDAQKKSGGDRPKSGGAGGAIAKKRKSEMTAGEAQDYAKKYGLEAFRSLPN